MYMHKDSNVIHEQLVSNMIYKLQPNYDKCSKERKQKIRELVEEYLDKTTSAEKKEAILDQFKTIKDLSQHMQPTSVPFIDFQKVKKPMPLDQASRIAELQEATEAYNKYKQRQQMERTNSDLEKESFGQKGLLQQKDDKSNFNADSLDLLVLLCYKSNETIIKMQEEQQELVKSLISLQRAQLERESVMMYLIRQQNELIQNLIKKGDDDGVC